MTLLVVGINHRTAPVELREKFALSAADAYPVMKSHTPHSVLDEVVFLSTCNRLEVYASAENAEDAAALIERFLSHIHPDLRYHLYVCTGDDAVQHLLRVASGLESMILGETQILGQVTRAFEEAHRAGMTGAVLSHLFAQAVRTGKRARSETSISRYTTSVSHAGARLLVELSGQPARVLIVGAGEMAALAAQALKRFETQEITFINRTYNRAASLADSIGGTVLEWNQLQQALEWADAVMCATSALHPVITREMLESVMPLREGRPLAIVDLAVPRNVESGVLPGVHIANIDDLRAVIDSNLELRYAAVPQVEGIIQQEMLRFLEWYHGRQVIPVIKNLREWAQNIADDELVQTLSRLSDADERTRQIVSRMAHRLVNRLMHEPTSRLRLQAKEGNADLYADALRELFALPEDDALTPPDSAVTG